MLPDFDLVRVAVALAMFGVACYFDLRSRSVSDLLWVVFAAAAGVLYIFDFPASWSEGLTILVSMGITAAASFGIYRSGLFGGADMLALITLSAILPVNNLAVFSSGSISMLHPFAPLAVLTNGVIISLVQVLANIARNAANRGRLFDGLQHEPTSRKLLAVMIGHRSASPKYEFPIEKVVKGKRRFDFSLMPAETTGYETRKDVWVASTAPFLVFLMAGLIVLVLFGDIMAIGFGFLR